MILTSIGEAMCAELPVVAHDFVAGPSEMTDNEKNSFLIPLFNDKLFVEKLQYLAEHKDKSKLIDQYARENIKKILQKLFASNFIDLLRNPSAKGIL